MKRQKITRPNPDRRARIIGEIARREMRTPEMPEKKAAKRKPRRIAGGNIFNRFRARYLLLISSYYNDIYLLGADPESYEFNAEFCVEVFDTKKRTVNSFGWLDVYTGLALTEHVDRCHRTGADIGFEGAHSSSRPTTTVPAKGDVPEIIFEDQGDIYSHGYVRTDRIFSHTVKQCAQAFIARFDRRIALGNIIIQSICDLAPGVDAENIFEIDTTAPETNEFFKGNIQKYNPEIARNLHLLPADPNTASTDGDAQN